MGNPATLVRGNALEANAVGSQRANPPPSRHTRRHDALARGLFGDTPDVEVQALHPYGIGIDTHKEFIQVCVLVQDAGKIVRNEREFQTSWECLLQSVAWARLTLSRFAVPHNPAEIRYTIESTGTYHFPVLRAWGGVPSVINPMLAGQTKRKTDVLDARALSHHSICGLWPASFTPEQQLEVLRILVNMRYEAARNTTRCSNRINNNILRFGHTLGRDNKMGDTTARACIEDMCRGVVPKHENICPDGLPEKIRPFFLDAYKMLDGFQQLRDRYHGMALNFVFEHDWPTAFGRISGDKLLKCLQSVPGVGEVTALIWLAIIGDPRRFEFPKQVFAFCGADPSLKVSAGKVTSYAKRKGNARLHHALKNVAAQLIRRHNEPVGQWGYAITRRTAKGGWAKGTGAVSRRLVSFLWRVHQRGEHFSFDKYRFMDIPDVEDVPVEAMNLGKIYTKKLQACGLQTSVQIAKAFATTMPQTEGIGAGCLTKVKVWLDGHLQSANRLKSKDSSSSAKSVDGGKKSSRKRTRASFVPASRTTSSATESDKPLTRGMRAKLFLEGKTF